ncbi:hypothetical protein ACVXG7_10055 [Enterobacter hormaechei]
MAHITKTTENITPCFVEIKWVGGGYIGKRKALDAILKVNQRGRPMSNIDKRATELLIENGAGCSTR